MSSSSRERNYCKCLSKKEIIMASEVFVAREDSVNPVNAVNGSSFGETFDRRNAGAARAQARTALDGAVTPRLYGTTTINLGV